MVDLGLGSFWNSEFFDRFLSYLSLYMNLLKFLRCFTLFFKIFFWVKQTLKNEFLSTKYPNHDVSVTLWSPKSRPIDDAISVFFLKKIKKGQHVICPLI
jgi:hypothetical protein